MVRHVPVISSRSVEPDNDNTVAIEADGAFFGRHRWRRFHARPSLPRELEGWGPLTHLHQNWIVSRVTRNRRGQFIAYERIGVSFPDVLPDQENFLSRLWTHFEVLKARGCDGIQYLSADELQELFADVLKGPANG